MTTQRRHDSEMWSCHGWAPSNFSGSGFLFAVRVLVPQDAKGCQGQLLMGEKRQVWPSTSAFWTVASMPLGLAYLRPRIKEGCWGKDLLSRSVVFVSLFLCLLTGLHGAGCRPSSSHSWCGCLWFRLSLRPHRGRSFRSQALGYLNGLNGILDILCWSVSCIVPWTC